MENDINILSQKSIDRNIGEHVVVRLIDAPSSIRNESVGMKSGLIRITSSERLKRIDKNLRKDLKCWWPSISEINAASNTVQEQTRITEHEFDNVSECLQFIRSYGNKCVILILSHHHANNKEVRAMFKKLPQIIALYCDKTEEGFTELMSNINIQPALAENNVAAQEGNIILQLDGNVSNISQQNTQIQQQLNGVEPMLTGQLTTEVTMNNNHIGPSTRSMCPLNRSHFRLMIGLIITFIVVCAIVISLAIILPSHTHSATNSCQPIVCSAIPLVKNPSSNYQVEHLDFTCSESLSNMSIVQIVQRTLNETHAQQYQTFWNYSTNMTYVVTPTQLIYEWYSLPGMLIVQESFPHFIEAQYYYTPSSVRNTSGDTWQIWLQSICGETQYLFGTY